MVMGGGGVFGNPPFVWHSSVRLVSGESHALRPVPGRSGGSCAPKAVPSLRASRATPPPPIPQLRLVQGELRDEE